MARCSLVTSLWKFGRRMLSDLGQGRIRIAVEYSALRAFVERGVVHKASSNFEATIATRISVLNTFLKLMDSIYFLPEPAPYIFRLTPPDRIIIDVDNNNVGQTVQGLTFNDSSSYVAFAEEFDRLAQASRLAYPLEAIIASLRNVRDNLTKGAPVLM